MSRFSDAHHFRKTVAGFCMIAAPLALLAGVIVHPERHTSEAAQVATIAANQDAWYVSHLLILIGIALAVPVVLGLMHMLREREVAWGHIGGALGLLGLVALTATVAIEGLVGWQMAATGADPAQMVALLERMNETTGVVIPVFIVSFGFSLGMLVLAAGLYRARAVQSWMALFVAVGVVLLSIAGTAASDVLSIVGAAFLFVGLASIGRMVVMESDEEWEHTPEYDGFRPLLGM